jgi:hypothetical protein
VHLLTATLLAEARRRGAVLDAIEHHDLIAQLDLVAHGLTTLPTDEALEIVDPTIALSETCIVRALCPAAADWFARGPRVWWEADEVRLTAAMCWAHCNGRSRQAIDSVSGDKGQALRVISTWADSLDVPFEKVGVAIASIDRAKTGAIELLSAGLKALRRQDAPTDAPIGAGHLYATLMREHGQPLEYFLFDVSEAQLDILIESLARRNLEDDFGPIGADGTTESAAARRRRANWTAAKLEFLRRVLPPAESAVTPGPGDATRTTAAPDPQPEPTRPASAEGTPARTKPSATETRSAPQATATVVAASSQPQGAAS